MIVTNYHTHNELCDGRGSLEDYIMTAVNKGMTALGFSSHAPIPVSNEWALTEEKLDIYLEELDRLKFVWEDRIQLYKGLEIDYIPGVQGPADTRWDGMDLDYKVGSVHSSVGLDRNPAYHCVDGSQEDLHWLLEEVHEGSFMNLCKAYYTRVAEMIKLGGFAFLGHLDLVKKHNRDGRYFSEEAPWYRGQVKTVLDVLEGSGIILEVNSGAISRGALDEVYPSPWILAEARLRDIPVMINADAHRPEDVDYYHRESLKLLREAGYRGMKVLLDGQWTTTALS